MFFKLLNKVKSPNKIRLVPILLLFVNVLCSQENVLDTLLAQPDSHKYNEMIVILASIDKKPFHKTLHEIQLGPPTIC